MISPALIGLLELALLTAAYWLVDRAIRLDGAVAVLRRLGVGAERTAVVVMAALAAAASPFLPWEAVPQGDLLRFLAAGLITFLAWKATTQDVDVVTGEVLGRERVLLALCAPASLLSPALAALGCFLLTTPFRLWQHHSTLPMRALQAVVAFSAVSPAGLVLPPLFSSAAVLMFFLTVMVVSHYLITALAKGWLGPRWYSWAWDNRLHYLAASAYSWGWARFVPWPRWKQVIAAVKGVERPLQVFAFTIELLSPLALLHRDLAVGLCLSWAAFHAGVAALSGLLFWDWILTDLMLAAVLALLPAEVAAQAFGSWQLVAGVLFLALFPLRHKLWKPMPLGWYDSPFTQRIHWRVVGQSGAVYGLYNDFMCPHERLYGKVHGSFLAPLPVVTYHLGEVYKRSLRDALVAAGPDLERLAEVRHRFGIDPRSQPHTERHVAYLKAFFAAVERGARKHVLPPGLRWLKAPGDQLFYWGALPPYRGQEPARQVTLSYREEYFDGEELRCLTEQDVLEVALDGQPPPVPVRELTPKEMDDYLLGLAVGRLVDLPGFSGGYVKTDDGKSRSAGAGHAR